MYIKGQVSNKKGINTYKCPNCRSSHIQKRSTKRPKYKCYDCKHSFDNVVIT